MLRLLEVYALYEGLRFALIMTLVICVSYRLSDMLHFLLAGGITRQSIKRVFTTWQPILRVAAVASIPILAFALNKAMAG